eukprot:Platyproteum_vivax@DN5734_c0_g1_i1.p1
MGNAEFENLASILHFVFLWIAVGSCFFVLIPLNIPTKKPALIWFCEKGSRYFKSAAKYLFVFSCSLTLYSFFTSKSVVIGVVWCTYFGLVVRFCEVVEDNAESLISLEETAAAKRLLAWRPPPLYMSNSILYFYNWFFVPTFHNVESLKYAVATHRNRSYMTVYDQNLMIPVSDDQKHSQKCGMVFAGNHTLLGIDMPALIDKVYRETGVFCRGLGDHWHFYAPFWSHMFEWYGAVDGTRQNCETLLRNGESIMVYPGGSEEVLKHSKTPKYALLWGSKIGFARIAIEHGSPIMPVSAVGLDDFLHILLDIPVGRFINRPRQTLPVCAVPLHKAQKMYFRFGEMVDTMEYKKMVDAAPPHKKKEVLNECATAVRDIVQAEVQKGIDLLLQDRDFDPDRYFWRRLANQIIKMFQNGKESDKSSSLQTPRKKKTGETEETANWSTVSTTSTESSRLEDTGRKLDFSQRKTGGQGGKKRNKKSKSRRRR